MADSKPVLILDTCVVISHGTRFNSNIEKLSELYSIFVTDLTISEIQSQKFQDFLQCYRSFNESALKCDGFFEWHEKRSVDEQNKLIKQKISDQFHSIPQLGIIPFKKDEQLLDKILERIYLKTPPFINGPSDKGFKDTLMWLSILEYFTQVHEEKVVFVTSDKAFLDNIPRLQEEYNIVTGNEIEIASGDDLEKKLGNQPQEDRHELQNFPPDYSILRGQIAEVMNSIIYYDSADYWGNVEQNESFTINNLVNAEYIEAIFSRLKRVIDENALSYTISAKEVFDLDGRVLSNADIPMSSIENMYKLYTQILQYGGNLVRPFYTAVAHRINQVYRQSTTYDSSSSVSDDIPF